MASSSLIRWIVLAVLLHGTALAQPAPPRTSPPGPTASPAPQPAPAPPAQGAAPPALPTPLAPTAPGRRILGLEEAVQTARERQPQLIQARAASEAASARVGEAFAPLLPQVTGTAAYQRTTANFAPSPGTNPSGTLGGGSSSWNTTSYWNLNATVSQLVWDFGQASGRWRAAQAGASSQRETERATLSQVLLSVRANYFNARANKDLVGVARDTLANQQAHLRQIEGFVRAGTRPEIDLAQARTAVANAQVQLINAENGYLTAKALLNQAMGVDEPADYDVGDETLPPVRGEDLPSDPLVQEAVLARPDIAAIEQQVRSQQLTLSSVQGAYGPALGVSTTFRDQGPDATSLVWNWNAVATLTWNIFQGGLTRSQEQEARANIANFRAQAETLRQQVRVDVEQARLAVRASKGALDAAAIALLNAREQLRLAEGRYQAGVGSVIELGDAQVTFTTAAAQQVQAQYNLSTSRAQLVRALGRDLTGGTSPGER